MDIIAKLTEEFKLKYDQVERTVALIDEGNTIPFIARYRKEVTGSLDDVVLRDLNDRLTYLRNLDKRREEVRSSITEQGKMTDEISAAIDNAAILTELEDIYRPFKPHRKTRASVAREKGLEGLATYILEQRDTYEVSIEDEAEKYISDAEGKEVPTAEDAINGAKDIIAEDISDNADFRKEIRAITFEYGVITTKAAKDEDSTYSMYYDFSEKVKTLPGHRVLAINRGEKEDFLKVTLEISKDLVLNYLLGEVITSTKSPAYKYIFAATVDSYDRLIAPSIEREIRTQLFDDASEGAIKLFSKNLKQLLLQPPVKGKVALGLDPGFRTGCKLAVVDATGKVLDTDVIFPTLKLDKNNKDGSGYAEHKYAEAKVITKKLLTKYDVEIIAIGNGTASRESERFIVEVLKETDTAAKYNIVSEAGASVYSASKLGAEEFPDFDVTKRSAVSIARRLQDPLAELVKIEPKAIGVGQYQHDMKPARLDEALSGVVEDCVNSVGVDINTASYSLLSYVAGINMKSAKSIVTYREENGEFKSRTQIKKVKGIGDKAYQQCAGFLRIPGGKEILDNTGVHPESYDAAKALLEKFGFDHKDIGTGKLMELRKQIKAYGAKKVCEELGIGEPTMYDILDELEKPGRDIRDALAAPLLRDDVLAIEDLKPDMILTGTVRNVIDFGAFIDIGVHQDGLVHVSQISDRFIKHPSEVLSVGDIVKVKVLSVDIAKKRIGLTMKFKS